MPRTATLLVLSDVHYASAAEQARGQYLELEDISHPLLRLLLQSYHRFVWMHRPLSQNYLLESCLGQAGPATMAVLNGDLACDTSSVGVSDDATLSSARECLAPLQERFGPNLRVTWGDHELGKINLSGVRGGMRLDSFHRVRNELKLPPFWRMEMGRYVLLGVASSLVALPVFIADTLPEERDEWEELRRQHLEEIRAAFKALKSAQRLLLFCHDPSALPFVLREPAVSARLPQLEQTFIGHLHSNLYLWQSRILAGMPVIPFLGHPVRRMSAALNEARHWKPFRIRLCPALAGIELLKDGGFYRVELDPEARRPARFQFQPLPR